MAGLGSLMILSFLAESVKTPPLAIFATFAVQAVKGYHHIH
jgi:hypothetical protein